VAFDTTLQYNSSSPSLLLQSSAMLSVPNAPHMSSRTVSLGSVGSIVPESGSRISRRHIRDPSDYDLLPFHPVPKKPKTEVHFHRRRIAAADSFFPETVVSAPLPEPEESPLHRACCDRTIALMEIEALLLSEPNAACRPEQLISNKKIYDPIQHCLVERLVKESYAYPLNLAIRHGASVDVISALIDSAPYVLALPDGQMKECSLAILQLFGLGR